MSQRTKKLPMPSLTTEVLQFEIKGTVLIRDADGLVVDSRVATVSLLQGKFEQRLQDIAAQMARELQNQLDGKEK